MTSGSPSSSPTTGKAAYREMKSRQYLMVTLGCFRNDVISDLMRSAMAELGYRETPSIEGADVILVNTCGFIEDACAEVIDTVLEIDELIGGEEARAPVLLFGCMGQRYGKELMSELPEVSGVLGVDWYRHLADALEALGGGGKYVPARHPPAMLDPVRYFQTFAVSTMMVRIADGCARGCAFCAIPGIKGPYRSRSPEEVISEIELLADAPSEVILLAQDATMYGHDITQESDLPTLIRSVTEIEAVRWLRLLYLQPEGIDERLIEEVVENEKVCNYFDIPFQHASRKILGRMKRPGDADSYMRLIARIRDLCPDAALRTTVMVGYPGETEEDFGELLRFIEDVRFDWLGAFRFSPEEVCPASELGGSVPAATALSRYNTVVCLQDSIESDAYSRLRGRTLEVVIDGPSQMGSYDLVGRSYREAPVVDGVVYLKGEFREELPRGFKQAKIVGREGLDLVGEV
jgi:ribosomal protein S12 methylthiotransferase